MKIAIVCFNLSWQAGGVRLIYSEAHALEKLGHKVTIYAPDFNPQVYPDLARGLDIRAVPPPRPILWQYKNKNLLLRIFEKIKRGRNLRLAARKIAATMDSDFEIVNLHDFSYLIAPYIKKKNPGAKLVWTMNDPPYMYLPKTNFLYDILSQAYNFWKDRSERRYFRFIDVALVLVERNKKWAEARGLRAEVLWSGLDFEKFYAPLKPAKDKKSRWNLLCVGALNRYRRFEDALLATKDLSAHGYDVFLTIVCKNIWKENEYEEQLVNFVKQHGLKDRVKLMFEGASDEELPRIYAKSDIFILPIHLPPPRNGFGWQLVGFEAMAAGVPTIVCNTNDVVEAVGEHNRALVVDPESPEQIAEKIKLYINRPEVYQAVAEAGQDFVRGMTWEKYARNLVDFSLAAKKK